MIKIQDVPFQYYIGQYPSVFSGRITNSIADESIEVIMKTHVMWVPYHYGMARPHVAMDETPSSYGGQLRIY
jgi:hypothetical protein